jgi:hypothetical protein
MVKVIIRLTMPLGGFINDQNGSVERLYPDLDTLRYAASSRVDRGDRRRGHGAKTFGMDDPDY